MNWRGPHLGFWSGNFFLIALFPHQCLFLHFQINIAAGAIMDADSGYDIHFMDHYPCN